MTLSPISYDCRIVLKSIQATFSRKRDLILLLFGFPILILIAIESNVRIVEFLKATHIVFKISLLVSTACFLGFVIHRRLEFLREQSVVARFALKFSSSCLYVAFWNALPFMLSLSTMVRTAGQDAQAWWILLMTVLSWVFGGGLGVLLWFLVHHLGSWLARRGRADRGDPQRELPGQHRRQRVVSLIASRTGLLPRSLRANTLACAMIGLGLAIFFTLLRPTVDRFAAELIVSIIMTGLVALLLRQSPQILRYLLYLGVGPVGPALVPLAPALSLIGTFAVVTVALGTVAFLPAAFIAGGVLLLLVVIALFRALHFALKPRHAAEIAMQIDLVTIVVAGYFFPPLAPAIIVWRLTVLYRRARDKRYLL